MRKKVAIVLATLVVNSLFAQELPKEVTSDQIKELSKIGSVMVVSKEDFEKINQPKPPETQQETIAAAPILAPKPSAQALLLQEYQTTIKQMQILIEKVSAYQNNEIHTKRIVEDLNHNIEILNQQLSIFQITKG
jgi:hypothetical protein